MQSRVALRMAVENPKKKVTTLITTKMKRKKAAESHQRNGRGRKKLENKASEAAGGDDVSSSHEEMALYAGCAAAMEQCPVVTTDGEKIDQGYANFTIKSLLKDLREFPDVTADSIKEWTGIDLLSKANHEYRRNLMSSRDIVWKDMPDGSFTIRHRASHGVENEDCLRHLFNVMLPSGQVKTKENGLSAFGIHEKELEDTFPEVESGIDMLCAEGVVVGLPANPTPAESQLWDREKRRVFFAKPPGVDLPASVRELWHDESLPHFKSELLQKLIDKQSSSPISQLIAYVCRPEERNKRLKEAKQKHQAVMEAAKMRGGKRSKSKVSWSAR